MEATAAGRSSVVSTEDLRKLVLQVRELERRVSALEQRESRPETPLALEPVPSQRLEAFSDAIPLAGFTLLGIGGAYLLRAFSELTTVPRGVGVAAGLGYAAMWLWLAARTSSARRLTLAVRVSTSVLILAPLVWESTIRFQTLPVWVAAMAVVAFCIAAEIVSWRKQQRTIAVVVSAACALLTLALLIGTHALGPCTLALVAIAAAVEFAAIWDRASGARWVVAVCADAAVLILAVLMRQPQGLPEGYTPISVSFAAAIQAALLAVYAASAIVRTLRPRKLAILEIGQMGIACLLGVGGIVAVAGLRLPAGVFAIVAGASCYAIASRIADPRNKRAYTAFGLLLTASSPWLALSGAALIVAWTALAVVASFWNPDREGDARAAVFLWLVLIGSQVATGSVEQFFGGGGSFPQGYAAMIMVASAVSYFAARRRIPAFFIAAGLACTATGQLASLPRFPCSPTIALLVAAMILAWAGVALHRQELVWLMYAFMGAAGLRIAWRDLPSATTLELVAPLLCLGAALILLPRILQNQKR